MKIHHVTIETLKNVELVSTAKIMDISLTGALRNVLTDMKRRLGRDIISKPMPKKHLDQMGKNIKG
jgi:DNA mismatch repair ATPase MutS